MIFSQSNEKIWQYQPVDSILDSLDHICVIPENLEKNEFTHIYDALKSAINDVKETGNLSLTNVILITDGNDFKSQTQINEIIHLVKDINIIILTINVEETADF